MLLLPLILFDLDEKLTLIEKDSQKIIKLSFVFYRDIKKYLKNNL